MKRVVQMGANRLPNSMRGSLIFETADSPDILSQFKVLEIQSEFYSELNICVSKLSEGFMKIVEDSKRLFKFVKSMIDIFGETNQSISSSLDDITNLLIGSLSFNSFLGQNLMKMSQSTQEFMGMAKMDIEEISALRRLYEHEKHMLHASQQKLFQYQQGKVRPQKLGEMEDEVKAIQQNVDKYQSELAGKLKTKTNLIGWSMSQQLLNILIWVSDFYDQGNQFCQNTVQRLINELNARPNTEDNPPKQEKTAPQISHSVSSSSLDQSKIVKFGMDSLPKLAEFEVTKGNNKVFLKKCFFEISVEKEALFVSTRGKEKKMLPIKNLLQVVPSRSNSKKMRLRWAEATSREEYLFSTPMMREYFYEFINLLLRRQAKTEYAVLENISVFVGTWNLGEATPPENLNEWLQAEGKYDIYCINVQECEYTPRGKMNLESDWLQQLNSVLGTDYIKLQTVTLVSIRMTIFVRREHFYKIRHIEYNTVATGVGGMWGNKGAIAISFTFNESTFCFIGSHLTPRTEHRDRRDAEYREILRSLKIGKKGFDLTNQFDFMFWCGDLNYRVDMPFSESLELISQNRIHDLRLKDQLLQSQKENKAFVGFEEMDITFPPTYRYNRGDLTYSHEKNRTPSYCDRILYRKGAASQITPLSYDHCPAILTSDHLPVRATFSIQTLMPFILLPSALNLQCIVRVSDLAVECNPAGVSSAVVIESVWIVFGGSALESTKSVTQATLEQDNFIWKELVEVYALHSAKEYLQHQQMLIAIKNGTLADIGQGSVSLKSAFESQGQLVPFKVPLFLRGIITGSLKGCIQIAFVPADLKRDLDRNQVSLLE